MQRSSSSPLSSSAAASSFSSSSSYHHLFPILENIPHSRSMPIIHRQRHSRSSLSVLGMTRSTTVKASSNNKDSILDSDDDDHLWWSINNNNNSNNNIVKLTTLPPFYVLEQSSMVIQHLPLHLLLERIDNFLRLKSIVSMLSHNDETAAQEEEAAVRLDCRISNSDGMNCSNFAIFLWKAKEQQHNNDDNTDRGGDDDDGGIIIEIQRRAGCCILMHHIQKSLFQYIMTGKEEEEEEEIPTDTTATASTITGSNMSSRTFCSDMNDILFYRHRVICPSIKRQEQEQRQQQPYKPEDEASCLLDNLEICMDLLQSNREDHKQMGMESLVIMTNPDISCKKLANAIAHALIYYNHHSNNDDDVDVDDHHDNDMKLLLLPLLVVNVLRNQLLKHLEHNEQPTSMQVKVMRESMISIDNVDIEELEYEEGHEYGISHNLALHILVNALQVVFNQSQNHQYNTTTTGGKGIIRNNIELMSDFWYTITKALVYNLSVAIHRPDEASISAKCLSLLHDICASTSSSSSQQQQHQHDLLTMLSIHDQFLPKKLCRAKEYGHAHHLRLEQESQHLLGRITSAQS